MVNNPISQPRFWAGTVLLALVFSASALRGPRAFRIGAAAVTAVVLVVFPYSDYFRYDKREPVHVVSLAEQFTSNGDYDAFQQIETGMDYVRTHGFTPTSALGPPLFFVPRAAWPDKPADAGIQLARHAGYTFENLSAPLWIETYMWAGFPSVVGVFALIGAVGRRIDDIRHRLRRHRGTLAALLVPAFGFYQLVLLRGSLMAIVGPLALLLFIPLLITRKQGRRTPAVRRTAVRERARSRCAPRRCAVTHRRSTYVSVFDEPSEEPDQLRDQLRQLFRYRALLLLGLVLGMLGGGAVSLFGGSTYTATGEVVVHAISTAPFEAGGVSVDKQISMGTERQIAQSASVAAAAAKALGDSAEPAVLQRDLRVSNPPETQTLMFEYSADSPRRAAALVNAFVHAYLDYRQNAATQRIDTTVSKLSDELKPLTDQRKVLDRRIANAGGGTAQATDESERSNSSRK